MAGRGSYFVTTLHRREPTGKYDRKSVIRRESEDRL